MPCKHESRIHAKECIESGTGYKVVRYICHKSLPSNRHPTKAELCQYCKNIDGGFDPIYDPRKPLEMLKKKNGKVYRNYLKQVRDREET